MRLTYRNVKPKKTLPLVENLFEPELRDRDRDEMDIMLNECQQCRLEPRCRIFHDRLLHDPRMLNQSIINKNQVLIFRTVQFPKEWVRSTQVMRSHCSIFEKGETDYKIPTKPKKNQYR